VLKVAEGRKEKTAFRTNGPGMLKTLYVLSAGIIAVYGEMYQARNKGEGQIRAKKRISS